MVNAVETKVLPEKQEKSKLVKFGQTINLNLGCLGMGLMTSVIGVTLLDLAEIYGTTTRDASHIITFRGCGALMGSLFGGMLLDRFNTQILITSALLIASIASSLIPICPTLPMAYAATFVYGLTVGIFDTGANIWIINLWGKKNGPMLQIYHFAFGIGGLLSPIVAEPFLSLHHKSTGDAISHSHSVRSIDVFDETSIPFYNGTRPIATILRPSRIDIPYGIIASVHFLLFISMFVFYWIDSSDTKPPPAVQNEGVTAGKCKRYTLLMCLSFYLMIYVALESCLGQMLSAFAVKSKLQFTKSQASYLSSLFWTTFTMSRVFSAFWALKSTPKCMMFTEHTMSLFAFGMFLWFGETNKTMVWACAAMVGIGAAGMYATVITWTVEFMPLTNKMMSISTIFSGSGGMAPPFIVGRDIDENPMILMYACTGLCVLLTIIMGMMWVITSTMTPRKSMVINAAELDYVEDAEKGAKAVVVAKM
ncbi:sodium-dependent glucose transporter 1A [Galendromus occidentalis]|uniref:Major facilitator superfamily domain-containing protein 4A n=1 Tax=Galendromus occidentalis TaxID=34638 RepID=A0AAJ6W0V4_9ACAR|nr:sodium-dependent glucose transporter 1A [Galendromus occidentalis]